MGLQKLSGTLNVIMPNRKSLNVLTNYSNSNVLTGRFTIKICRKPSCGDVEVMQPLCSLFIVYL